MNNLEAMIKEVVKEALKEVLAEGGLVLNKESVKEAPVKDAERQLDRPVATSNKEEKKVAPKTAKNVEKAQEEDTATPDKSATIYNNRKAELEALGFKDLQNLVKELGGKAVGGKAVLIDRILEAEGFSESDEEETGNVADADTSVNDDVNEENGSDEDENEEATLYDKVVESTKEWTDEELADLLADAGISPKGKRQALLTKIVAAVEEGKIPWEDENEDEDNEPTGEDQENALMNNSEDTPERLQTMAEIEDRIREQYKDKEISDKEIADFLNEYYNGNYKGTKVENLNNYVAIQRALVDEDGEEHDFQEAYYVGEDVHCCGAKVKELENGNLYCEICGSTYEQ